MLNFKVGPVQTWPEILEIGGKQVPYFRNQSFSKIMLENEKIMKELTYAEKLTDEANKKICSGEILQNLKPAAGKEFSDLPWEESEDMKEICDNFRIIERQRDLYRERCTRLQKENENLKRLLDKIQIVVCQYSNC